MMYPSNPRISDCYGYGWGKFLAAKTCKSLAFQSNTAKLNNLMILLM